MALPPIDQLSPRWQSLLSRLPHILSYAQARRLLLPLIDQQNPREVYLQTMKLEVFWLNAAHLKKNFTHLGIENIDHTTNHVFTSLHYGHWGMYPASLYQQHGIKSQMVATGRNQDRSSHPGHFWYTYGHLKQDLSGHPCCYSTDSSHDHIQRLKQGINLTIVADVRERGLRTKEVAVDFLGRKLYLQRSVATMARRAGVGIIPYIGWYDSRAGKHRIHWFPAVAPDRDPGVTMQRVADCWAPVFRERPEFYFNIWEQQTHPRNWL